jgi:hypothetical protein
MEEKTKLLDKLLERAVDYGVTSYELTKLKAVDKISDIVSALIPGSVFCILIITVLLFLNLGLALWLGELLGKIYFGFFAVAAFYCILGFAVKFLLNKWIKKIIGNQIVKTLLK